MPSHIVTQQAVPLPMNAMPRIIAHQVLSSLVTRPVAHALGHHIQPTFLAHNFPHRRSEGNSGVTCLAPMTVTVLTAKQLPVTVAQHIPAGRSELPSPDLLTSDRSAWIKPSPKPAREAAYMQCAVPLSTGSAFVPFMRQTQLQSTFLSKGDIDPDEGFFPSEC